MNRIDQKFKLLKETNEKALITFITAGDPDLAVTQRLIPAMEAAGADIIEIGVPFSDPIAEGPVIQEASLRSLQQGTTLAKIFEMVRDLRQTTDVPLLLMMYINSIFHYGYESFFKQCRDCGIDGVVVPDMPYEEKDEFSEYADRYGIYSISLVAPTSMDRVGQIAKDAKGFLYCVSSTGVTGVRNDFKTDFDTFFSTIKAHANIPAAVGFGISTPQQAAMFKPYCDGVIVGSAIVRLIAAHGSDCIEPVKNLVSALKQALL